MNNFIIKCLGTIMAFIFILLLVWAAAGETDKKTAASSSNSTSIIEIVGRTDL